MRQGFKHKFENFEPQVPEHLFDNIMHQIEVQEAGLAQKSFFAGKSKFWIPGVVAVFVVTLLSVILLNKDNINKELSEPLQTAQNTNDNQMPIQPDDNSVAPKEMPIKVEPQKQESEPEGALQQEVLSDKDTSKEMDNSAKQEHQKEVKNFVKPQIIAERYICGNACVLELANTLDGQWTSIPSVSIEKLSGKRYQAKDCPVNTSVLFTFESAGQQDTFTVFFRATPKISTEVLAENCGKSDGQIVLKVPEELSLSILGDYQFEDNTIKGLSEGQYRIALEDQYHCRYDLSEEVPQNRLSEEIEAEALHFNVGYPVYFSTKTEEKDLLYEWNFGDESYDFSDKPEHRYRQSGTYTVQLRLQKEGCPTQMLEKTIHIDDKPIEIPNVFTPNNDGKNDLFFVNLPEETTSFEAFILTTSGHLVYKWSDTNDAWDGRWQNGQEAKAGSYLYILRGKDSNRKSFEYKSVIKLIR